ncbi:MAG: oxidoreductase [Cereibacter sphaeroides]|uniref:Oxidoreductase n=1 Tax=Cereibacter sphaeroides TaxID=1063 RepID=A0A2W5TMA2_CERSP|nr:MAG: oxidoreductase [Cereibacter sphaeroides]
MTPSGNTILMTGGTSGIGLALARAFLAQGNEVIIASRRQSAVDQAVAENPGLKGYVLDVAEPASFPAFVAKVMAAHPKLNVLFNNAGIMQAEKLLDADPAIAEATIAINLLGPIRLTAAFLPHLLAQPKSTIVNTTSGLAFVPLALTPTYSATKAALHSYTQSLRYQLRDTPVEVLELAPPEVGTELMPGQSKSPTALPLEDYISETMSIFAQQPTPAEVLVQRVNFLRRAEAEGRFDETFAVINSRH